MPPLISAMTAFRNAFVAAVLKSFLRGKSLLQALFAFLLAPQSLRQQRGSKSLSSATTTTSSPTTISPPTTTTTNGERSKASGRQRTVDEFLEEAGELLLDPIDGDGLLALSAGLKAQFRDGLQRGVECMLPSYNHLLPTGREEGRYLALDVGGSTLRVALVELRAGEGHQGRTGGNASDIVRITNFRIDAEVKALEGMAFFDWMAARILETITKGPKQDQHPDHSPDGALPMSLAWSFPIEQTSLKGGRILGMGKGFLAEKGVLGQDLGEVIKTACRNRGLDVELQAILNDSTATLLSQAYAQPTTRFGLILGTGINIAAYLPVSSVSRAKFGARPDAWFADARHVVVNTELGMFGRDGVLPVTRWDRALKAGHPRPEFQPLEQMVGGFYLGEICRLALVEAVEETGLLGGVVPPSLRTPYSLDTETLSCIEGDASPDLEKSCLLFGTRHPSSVSPTTDDMIALRTLASCISRRSSALMATCVYTLWQVRRESGLEYAGSLPEGSAGRAEALAETQLDRTMVAFNGSVIEHYPGYLASCQGYINGLVATEEGVPGSIDLVAAKESSLLGAAVALACVSHAK